MLVCRIELKLLRSFFITKKKQRLPVTPGSETSETMVVLLKVNCLRLKKGGSCLTISSWKLSQATRVKSTHCLDQVEGRIDLLFHSILNCFSHCSAVSLTKGGKKGWYHLPKVNPQNWWREGDILRSPF